LILLSKILGKLNQQSAAKETKALLTPHMIAIQNSVCRKYDEEVTKQRLEQK